MTVACETGDLSYGQDTATPNGAVAASGGANAELAFQNGPAQAGSVVINGEPGYGVTVSTTVGTEPTGVVFTPMLNVGAGAESSSVNAVIDSTSEQVSINLCGTLSVDSSAAPSAPISVSTDVLVSYR